MIDSSGEKTIIKTDEGKAESLSRYLGTEAHGLSPSVYARRW